MITQLVEQEERAKNTSEVVKKKEDMWTGMFKLMLLENKSVKRSQKQNRRKIKKRKEQRAEKKFKEITELISADISQPIITDVNVEGVASLTRDQIRYLKEMAKMGNFLRKHFLP